MKGHYTRIPNNVLEKVASGRLNGTQAAICLAIIRKTFGWNRSLSRLSVRQVAAMTTRHPTEVHRELLRLESMNIIKIERSSSVNRLGINLDLPPRTSPPSKLDLGPLEVHSTEQNRVLVTWGVWPLTPAADRPRRCEAVSGCTPCATSRLAPLLPSTCRRSRH